MKLGKKILVGWDREFDSQVRDAFEFANLRLEATQRFPSITHWFLALMRPIVAAGSANYSKLRKEGRVDDVLPERKEEDAKPSKNGSCYALVLGSRTYEMIRESATVANYTWTHQAGQRFEAPAFKSAADYLQMLLEEQIVATIQQMNEEVIKKETEELSAEILEAAKSETVEGQVPAGK